MINPDLLAERLCTRFGLGIVSESSGDSNKPNLSLRVAGIDPPNGFRVVIVQGWRSVDAVFTPDSFAAGLIRTLCVDDSQRRSELFELAAAFDAAGTRCQIRIDGKELDYANPPLGAWSRFELSCSRLTDKSDGQKDCEEVGAACVALLLTLLPLEEQTLASDAAEQGLPEGALTKVYVNRYERSPANRAAAIALHGSICNVCGFDFSKVYGEIGNGFIEVHHRIPVSHMTGGYVVNPLTDLIPLCANCHQMVHRENPPIEPDVLRKMLNPEI